MDLTQSVEIGYRELIRETEKAWHIRLPDGIYWLPKSQCRIVMGKIYLPKWLADEKGIDYLSCDIINS